MEYTMICQPVGRAFEIDVNTYLDNNWQLYGNPFAVYDPEYQQTYYYQAMTRED